MLVEIGNATLGLDHKQRLQTSLREAKFKWEWTVHIAWRTDEKWTTELVKWGGLMTSRISRGTIYWKELHLIRVAVAWRAMKISRNISWADYLKWEKLICVNRYYRYLMLSFFVKNRIIYVYPFVTWVLGQVDFMKTETPFIPNRCIESKRLSWGINLSFQVKRILSQWTGGHLSHLNVQELFTD